MLRKILVAGVISLLFLGMVHGQSDTEKRALAKMYYEEAEKKYGEGDCIGAREAVVVSRGYYEEIGDAGGMNSCDLLIEQINPCLAAKGEEIYVNAKDLFNTGQSYLDLEKYDLAKQNFLEANTTVLEAKTYFTYMLPPYALKIEACDNLSSQIAENIRAIILCEANVYLKNAHDIYHAGLDDYGTGYLLDSKENAQKAYEIYKSCNDSGGIYSAGRLVEKIEEDMLDPVELGKMLYNDGKEAYNLGGYDNYRAAINNFQKCSMYYEIVNKSLEKRKCDDMAEVALIPLLPYLHTEQDAHLKYESAIFYGNLKEWYMCVCLASVAKKMYYPHYQASLMKNDTGEAHRYELEIAKCDKLIEECEMATLPSKPPSEALYQKAMEAYNSAEYENALNYTKQALVLFEEINSPTGIRKCEILKSKIEEKKLLKKAKELYQKAQEAYNSAEYEKALNYAEEALELSIDLNDPAGITRCEMFKPRIEEKLLLLGEADSYYDEARGCYDRGDYGNATEYLSKAVDIYREINRYSEKFIEYQECVELNNSIVNAPIAETTTSLALEEESDHGSGMLLAGLAILFLAILILGAVFLLRRNRQNR